MSIEVIIKQEKLIKKNIKYNDLCRLAVEIEFSIGVLNGMKVNKDYEGGNNIIDKELNIYSKHIYGTGFSFEINEKKEITLIIPNSSTKTDVELFYTFIERLCKYLDVDTFLQEGLKVSVNDIPHEKEAVLNFNKKVIRQQLSMMRHDRVLTVYGCIYPISLEMKEFAYINKLTDEELFDKYEQYLNKKQEQDYYYSKPFILNENDEISLLFGLPENTPSILPIRKNLLPILDFPMKRVKEWYVSIGKCENDSLGMAGVIKYDDLRKALRGEIIEKFDENHCIYNLNSAMIKKLSKYIIPFDEFVKSNFNPKNTSVIRL